MAKKQSFGDKVLRAKADAKKMAKIVIAEKNANDITAIITRW